MTGRVRTVRGHPIGQFHRLGSEKHSRTAAPGGPHVSAHHLAAGRVLTKGPVRDHFRSIEIAQTLYNLILDHNESKK